MFDDSGLSRASTRMLSLINDANVSQITCDRYDRVKFIENGQPKVAENVFDSVAQYVSWVDQLMALTDVGYTSVADASVSVIEGSFDPDKTQVHGSIHVCTREITRAEPAVTIRKQPRDVITLDDMLNSGMMNPSMRFLLEQAVRARHNILIAGGSGAGKTTLARALSYYIDPWQRVVTVEEIDELHLGDRLHSVVALTTVRKRDDEGRLVRETTLDDLVRESLRMRADRVWVGETRGKEAYALVKACNSGHDGSVTTLHADTSRQAIGQAVTYVMESGLPEKSAQTQVQQAFDLVIHIGKVKMGKRVITEISEVENVSEGGQQRMITLWSYDQGTERFVRGDNPSRNLLEKAQRYGENFNVNAVPDAHDAGYR